MSCRLNYVNKATGFTYVYESVSFWDKEKKQSRNKRASHWKLDPTSGELISSKCLVSVPEQAALQTPTTTATVEILGASIVRGSPH